MARIFIRRYVSQDAPFLAKIFYDTIHTINAKDYTKEQLDAWAPESSLQAERWSEKFARTRPFVALVNEEVVGFAEFEHSGFIDCFYCHHDWIGKGVGSTLMQKIFDEAQFMGITRLFSNVSTTAKPFFEKKGFSILEKQVVVRNDVELINYKMEKFIS
ncbi:MAG: GNAT family N-acetyltransferase [Parachlamydiaceae bacterium]